MIFYNIFFFLFTNFIAKYYGVTSKMEREKDVKPGYFLQLKAKEDKGEEVAKAMRETITNIEREPGIIAWLGFRVSETEFGTFDVFIDEESRSLHKKEGMKRIEKLTPLLVDGSVVIKEIDIISAKLNRK